MTVIEPRMTVSQLSNFSPHRCQTLVGWQWIACLKKARRAGWRIWAENSPFELKDQLEARGYRWNGDGGPSPKAWCIDVDDLTKEQELGFLRNESISVTSSSQCARSPHRIFGSD